MEGVRILVRSSPDHGCAGKAVAKVLHTAQNDASYGKVQSIEDRGLWSRHQAAGRLRIGGVNVINLAPWVGERSSNVRLDYVSVWGRWSATRLGRRRRKPRARSSEGHPRPT